MKGEYDGKCAYVEVKDPNGEGPAYKITDATGPPDAKYWIVFKYNGNTGEVTGVNKMSLSKPSIE